MLVGMSLILVLVVELTAAAAIGSAANITTKNSASKDEDVMMPMPKLLKDKDANVVGKGEVGKENNLMSDVSSFIDIQPRHFDETANRVCDISESVMRDCKLQVKGSKFETKHATTIMTGVRIECEIPQANFECIQVGTSGHSLTIIDSVVTGVGNNKGRFIYMSSGTKLRLTGVKQESGLGDLNAAGGFIFASSNYDIEIIESKLENNKAESGGAVHLHGYGKLTVADSSFVKNTAKNTGGAICGYGTLTKTDWKIENSYFTENEATTQGHGGAIRADNIKATIKKTEITKNIGANNGAGVGLGSSTFSFHCCLVAANTETGAKQSVNGGGIRLYNNAEVTLIKTIFIDNKGKDFINDIGCNAGDKVTRDFYLNSPPMKTDGACSFKYILPWDKENDVDCTQ